MKQYLELCRKVLDEGTIKSNRTGTDTIGIHGAMLQFNLAEGFPAVTTKKLQYKSCFAEMLGFLRGYDNAADFRKLGCNVWDANANENKTWLNNTNRRGTDHLGCIYGVQARDWQAPPINGLTTIDQLKIVIDKLLNRKDDRRLIVTHWNPGELSLMALPPCHLLYQFGIEGNKLNLSMYQRSCDMPLGVPFNIAGYAWLLSVIAKITGLIPGTFTHFMHDVHIYVNQIDSMREQLDRKPFPLPKLLISDRVTDLDYLETEATMEDFKLFNYEYHPAIKYPFSV